MTNEDFEKVLKSRIEKINKVLGNKAKEYASKNDRLHNFNEAKSFFRCNTKEYALLGMLNKHLVSVVDMVEKYEKHGILPSQNILDEKIGDTVNYLILLEACFSQDITDNATEKGKEGLCCYGKHEDKLNDDVTTKEVFVKEKCTIVKFDEKTNVNDRFFRCDDCHKEIYIDRIIDGYTFKCRNCNKYYVLQEVKHG